MASSPSSSQKSIQQHLAETSYFERLALTPKKLWVLGNFIVALVTAKLYRRTKKPPTYYRYVIYTAIRTLMRITTVGQQHSLQPTSDEAYLIACRKLRLQPASETLPDGTSAHWIGPPTARKLLVNFHGGGYVLAATPDQYEFLSGTRDVLCAQGIDVAVLFLCYDLAPKAKYPRPLQQATALIMHIVHELGRSPSDIILIGDSAGANLITQLISHISHPHPSVPALALAQDFRGICLISPWISFATSSASFTRNAYADILTAAAGKKWSAAFMGTPWPHHANADAYNEALRAPRAWWVPIRVRDVLLTAGADELLIDDVRRFAHILQEAVGPARCALVVATAEMHAQPILDLSIGYRDRPCASTRAIRDWLGEKFRDEAGEA